MVRQTIINVDTLNILDKQKWWDIFLTSIRSKTVDYTKQKYFIENSIREKIKQDLLTLEAIPSERLTPALEKRSAKGTVIGELRHPNGEVYSDKKNLMNIMTDFYTDLYTPSPVDESLQEKLLGNVDRTLSDQQKNMLDDALSEKELQQTVYGLKDEKSPGIGGFTAEFYKKFWSLIKNTEFINCANQTSFSQSNLF